MLHPIAMIRAAAILMLMLAACTPAESPGPSVAAPPSEATPTNTEPAATQAVSEPAAAEAPVTITGSGIENSAPFLLDGGIYLVEWTAIPHSDQGCYHGAELEAVDPDAAVFEPLANELLDSAAPKTGTTYIYDLAGGDYYVHASSGCDWSFTFTAQ